MSTHTSFAMPLFARAVAGLLLAGAALGAQTVRPRSEPDSARAVVQHFYDWYLPRAANPRGRDVIMEAATRGPLPFNPELVRWLRIDSTAQARASGEIDGLDGDPYLNAQDPCDAYTARSATRTDSSVLVGVLGHGGCAEHVRLDVLVEVARRGGHSTILDFRDPARQNEGTIPLLRRLHPAANK